MLDHIPKGEYICNYCHPNHEKELMELGKHLINPKTGMWIKGYSKKKATEYNEIRKKFEEGKRVTCIMIDPEHGDCICKKCLQQVVDNI